MLSTQDLIAHFIELVAALSASYYWIKTKDQAVRPFVWYLWLIVFVETFGLYPYLYIRFDHPYIDWIEHSRIARNTWLYNIRNILDLYLIGLFVKRNTKSKFTQNIINIVVSSCVSIIVLYFVISGNFFKTGLQYNYAISTFAIFVMVITFFNELLKSDDLLEFYKSHVFYILTSLMLFEIFTTPIFLYSGYFSKINENFITFRFNFLFTSIILLYSCYTFAFLYSLYHKKQSAMKK